MMNGCFRTVWLTLLLALSLINPGLLSVGPDGCSHAAGNAPPVITPIQGNAPPAITPIQPPALTKPEPVHAVQTVARREGSVYAVQAAACRHKENARNMAESLKEKGYTPVLHSWEDPSGRPWHSVFLGVYDDAAEAGRVADRYREAEGTAVFVKTLGRLAPAVPPAAPVTRRQVESPARGREEGVSEGPRAVRDEGPGVAQEEESGPAFACSGFIEFESFVNTGTSQKSFRDKNKKNEIRNRLQMRYGTDTLYLFSVSNMYWFQTYLNARADDRYRYAKDQRVSRNLTLSSQEAELSFDELYFNYGRGRFRLRAGNQIYGWGTADAFNPTSYFNPSDMREILFRDDDEDTVGVPSLSGMFFLGDYTLEAVFVPVHIPPIMAPEGNFWALSTDSFLLPVVVDDPEQLDANSSNCGYGLRLSTSRGGVDMSVSGYRGPDRNLLFLPYEVIYQGGTPAALRVRPRTSIVTLFGFDLSAALGDFVVQFEAAYSPDKAGIVEQKVTSLTDLPGLTLPFEIDRAHSLSYAAGFNYFIPMDRLIEGHTGDAVFTFEWFKAQYLEGGLYAPSITDIVSCKFEDSYFDGRVKTTVKGVFDMKHGGKVFWPEIGYDFQNGFLVEVGYAAIWTDKGSTWENDSIFYYFKGNDLFMAKVRYRY